MEQTRRAMNAPALPRPIEGGPLPSKEIPSKAKPSGTSLSWQNAGKILKTLPKAELDKLPKLSETILKFGAPILDDAPPGATAAEYRSAMTLVEMAWNFPIVTQHSTDSAAIVKELVGGADRAPTTCRSPHRHRGHAARPRHHLCS
jgi:hypothetical protein